MKLREVKTTANELMAMPKLVNNALAAAFVALLFATAALIIVTVRSK